MISNQRLKEFGFDNEAKFPKLLTDHAVTVSLPTAIAHHLPPASVVIGRGLVIPVQMPGVPNGMIIKNDGTMVYVAHQDPTDFTSPVKVSFTDDIAYDVRVQAYNIMRRAIEVDPGLNGIWQEIQAHWVTRYPPFLKEIERQSAGHFLNIREALEGLVSVVANFTAQAGQQSAHKDMIPLKVIVQTAEQLERGWQGEEFLVEETLVGQVLLWGPQKYVLEHLTGKLRVILKNPVFISRSTFQLYYEPRIIPAVKLVVIPPVNAGSGAHSHGIDLD